MNETAHQTAAEIAKRILGIATLQPRNSDRLDFRELSVWQVERALVAAYEAGLAARRTETNNQ